MHIGGHDQIFNELIDSNVKCIEYIHSTHNDTNRGNLRIGTRNDMNRRNFHIGIEPGRVIGIISNNLNLVLIFRYDTDAEDFRTLFDLYKYTNDRSSKNLPLTLNLKVTTKTQFLYKCFIRSVPLTRDKIVTSRNSEIVIYEDSSAPNWRFKIQEYHECKNPYWKEMYDAIIEDVNYSIFTEEYSVTLHQSKADISLLSVIDTGINTGILSGILTIMIVFPTKSRFDTFTEVMKVCRKVNGALHPISHRSGISVTK